MRESRKKQSVSERGVSKFTTFDRAAPSNVRSHQGKARSRSKYDMQAKQARGGRCIRGLLNHCKREVRNVWLNRLFSMIHTHKETAQLRLAVSASQCVQMGDRHYASCRPCRLVCVVRKTASRIIALESTLSFATYMQCWYRVSKFETVFNPKLLLQRQYVLAIRPLSTSHTDRRNLGFFFEFDSLILQQQEMDTGRGILNFS